MKLCVLLFSLVNVHFCFGQDDEVAKAFAADEVVKDVIDVPPPIKLEVVYRGSDRVVDLGNELAPVDVREVPDVPYKLDEGQLYAVAMVDPDAPSRKNPIRREFLHWLVVNVHGPTVGDGDVISEYVGSGPPKDTGLHRYVFLLYKQPGRIEVDEPRQTRHQGTGRASFSIRKFAEKYSLGNPIAGNFYQARYDESVPSLHKQLSN